MNRLRKFAASIGVTLVAFGPLLFATPASAESVSGLNVEVYTYDSSATPDRVPYTLCEGAWTHVDNIDSDFDNQFNGIVAGCQQEFVLVHYTGFVTFPETGEYSFLALADDGFWMSLDGVPVITEDWVLKGRSGNTYSGIQIEGGHTYALDAWFYEYGGGANVTLYYSTPTKAFEVVPNEFLTTDGSAPPVVVPPFLNPPLDVNAVVTGIDVKVTWKAPIDSGTAVEHYALSWTYDGQPGWGVGVWGNEFVVTNLPENKEITFWVRADNDTLAVYSGNSSPVLVTTSSVVVPPIDPPVDPEPPVDPPVVDPPTGPVEEPTPPVEIPEPRPEPELPVLPPVVTVPEPPVETSKPPVSSVDPATINPQELSAAEVVELKEAAHETLATAPEGSPAYEQALEQLMVAAQADDIVVDEELAAVPVIGAVAVGITNALNALGNFGADMSPKVREESKKIVVSAIVAVGAAVSAATGAATSAASAAASSSPSRKIS